MNALQAAVLKSILKKDNWGRVSNILSEETFTETTARKIYSIVKVLHGETSEDLSSSDITLHIEASYMLNTTLKDELLYAMSEVSGAVEPARDMLINVIKRFAGRSKWLKLAEYIASHVDDDEFDGSVPTKMAAEAGDLASTADATVIDYLAAPAPSSDIRPGVVPLGIHSGLDAALDGGTGNGELTIFLAPTGVGKTSFLLNKSANAARLGKNVLEITLEINSTKCIARVDQCLTHMTKAEMISNPFAAMEKRKALAGKGDYRVSMLSEVLWAAVDGHEL